MRGKCIIGALLLGSLSVGGTSRAGGGISNLAAIDKFRFLAMTGYERDVIGAKILGSNTSPVAGYVELGEIKTAPAPGEWGELTLAGRTPMRWIKYAAAPGSHGRIGRMQLYAGETRLKPKVLSIGEDSGKWNVVLLSDKADAHHAGSLADNQYVIVDLGDAATGPPPIIVPEQSESDTEIQAVMKSKTAGAVIRYTLDGTIPTEDSAIYAKPLLVDKTTTISAAAFFPGLAPTRPTSVTYIIGKPVHKKTLHIGNSLTRVTEQFDLQARTAGAIHESDRYLIGGGLTKTLWHAAMDPIGDPGDANWVELYGHPYPLMEIQWGRRDWTALWPKVSPEYTDLTLQPRDYDVAEEADFDNRFLTLIEQKAPNIQPWLYMEWTERARQRPTDLGTEPTTEVQTVYPALTWEESMSAMMLYGEDLRRKVSTGYRGAKPIRIIPAALAMGWLHRLIETGQMPGFAPDEFFSRLFKDDVHLNEEGAYLVNCMFYAAFYRESPEGKFLPLGTRLTAAQAKLMQHLAWETFKNYPYSGLYEAGTAPAGKPKFSYSTGPTPDSVRVTLTSATPEAWFRYTLDGTTPSRTNGYIYCGAISAKSGMTLKAIAYKSGMADSSLAQSVPPPGL
jgi:hypothetical protein